MPQTFIVDQAATFQAVAFLGATPKLQFGSQMQDTDKAGVPKWEVTVIATFADNFGKQNHETIKVGVTSPKNPGEGLNMYTPVALHHFTVGVMDKTITDKNTGEIKVVGAQVWYRCEGLRPVQPKG
jgi:hypothetical protein